jgi:hypothetical protein
MDMLTQQGAKMKALQAYIDRQNKWNAMFKGPQYEIQTAQGRKRVAEVIDCALSPENLSCDGELSRTETNRRYRELTGAARDLVKLDPTVAQYMCEFG